MGRTAALGAIAFVAALLLLIGLTALLGPAPTPSATTAHPSPRPGLSAPAPSISASPEVAGVTAAPSATNASPAAPTPAPSGIQILLGAGDIANCTSGGDAATARLLDQLPGTVFTAGDNALPDGSESQFTHCYAPTWGRHVARTRPAPGERDWATKDFRRLSRVLRGGRRTGRQHLVLVRPWLVAHRGPQFGLRGRRRLHRGQRPGALAREGPRRLESHLHPGDLASAADELRRRGRRPGRSPRSGRSCTPLTRSSSSTPTTATTSASHRRIRPAMRNAPRGSASSSSAPVVRRSPASGRRPPTASSASPGSTASCAWSCARRTTPGPSSRATAPSPMAGRRAPLDPAPPPRCGDRRRC